MSVPVLNLFVKQVQFKFTTCIWKKPNTRGSQRCCLYRRHGYARSIHGFYSCRLLDPKRPRNLSLSSSGSFGPTPNTRRGSGLTHCWFWRHTICRVLLRQSFDHCRLTSRSILSPGGTVVSLILKLKPWSTSSVLSLPPACTTEIRHTLSPC
jgi:hypothetical protein